MKTSKMIHKARKALKRAKWQADPRSCHPYQMIPAEGITVVTRWTGGLVPREIVVAKEIRDAQGGTETRTATFPTGKIADGPCRTLCHAGDAQFCFTP